MVQIKEEGTALHYCLHCRIRSVGSMSGVECEPPFVSCDPFSIRMQMCFMQDRSASKRKRPRFAGAGAYCEICALMKAHLQLSESKAKVAKAPQPGTSGAEARPLALQVGEKQEGLGIASNRYPSQPGMHYLQLFRFWQRTATSDPGQERRPHSAC